MIFEIARKALMVSGVSFNIIMLLLMFCFVEESASPDDEYPPGMTGVVVLWIISGLIFVISLVILVLGGKL